MKKIKSIIKKIDKIKFVRYLILLLFFMTILVIFGSLDLTNARYETETNINMEPKLAFFITNVESQTGQIQLDGMIPSNTPYVYRFDVSNFYKNKKANVDLKYEIEIVTTTNIPLTYKVYKGNELNNNIISDDYYEQDSNGVYYRHLKIDNISYFNHDQKRTDIYSLTVEFKEEYKNLYKEYAGVIELVDIKVNAEQVI